MSGDKTPVHAGTVGLKAKALHGAVRFAGMFVYLWAMFILFGSSVESVGSVWLW